MKDVGTFRIQLLCQLTLSVTCARPISLLEYPEELGELWVVTTDQSIYCYDMLVLSTLYAGCMKHLHDILSFLSARIETTIAESLDSKEETSLADTSITCEPKSLLIGSQVGQQQRALL